jgi:hypothetical protein
MYNKSKWAMGSTVLITTLLGLNAYRLTKDQLWLLGSGVTFSIFAFTYFAIMGINKKLATDEKAAQKGVINKGIA